MDHLTKIYKLYDRPRDRFFETLGLSQGKRLSRDHYALQDVSFDVHRGESIGIIGTNGSGKSTILKIITGVLSPSAGEVTVNGRISALLELGAGFNMEYTGIENIYLNGTMIGFSKEEIDAKLQSILDFADIGDFVHQPVKTYSSGMFVRLAFAVAINIEPEILIVDEALSVGDVFFQAKCYRKFEEFRQEGKTIIFVSHDLGSICKYCDKVVLLNKGVKLSEGEPNKMVDLYKKLLVGQLDLDTLEAIPAPEHDRVFGQAGSRQQSAAEADMTGQQVGGQDTAGQQAGGYDSSSDSADGLPHPYTEAVPGSSGDDSRYVQAFPVNPNINEYGDREAEIVGFNILDDRGLSSNTIRKGSRCSIVMKVLFHKRVEEPIFAFTITNLKGTDITGTNTLFEKSPVRPMEAGQVQEITFTQAMDMQGGEYMLSLGCTGYNGTDFVVHHRLYQACGITIISTQNTVGFYDTNSEITLVP